MTYTDHYMGAQEHSITNRSFLNYHRYVPHEYIKFDLIDQTAAEKIESFYDFFVEENKELGFIKQSMLKKNSCGLWITTTDDTFTEDLYYHPYHAFDYRAIDVDSFYALFGKQEPELLKKIREEKIDVGIEGVSLSTTGDVMKYIMLFRPVSNIIELLNLPEFEKLQKFVDLNFSELKAGEASAPDSFKSPIRVQFDSDDDTISVEFVSAFYQKELYLSGGNYDSYLNRKQKYFDRMAECDLLDSDEIQYCKENSPSWQQFSIKFKWKGGIMVDKKLYTFDVVDFERVV